MYVITGATGYTGSVAAEKLLASGAKVRVIGRDAKRLERFSKMGAEAVVADMADPAAAEKAFSGASAVHVLMPPNISAPDVPRLSGAGNRLPCRGRPKKRHLSRSSRQQHRGGQVLWSGARRRAAQPGKEARSD